MKLLLIRHGRMAGDPYCEPGSPVAGCLHPDGVAQAEALGRALAATPIDAAFSSPYGRAVETAERALAGRGVEVVRVPGLQEWTPSPQFRHATSTEASAMAARDADRWAEETWKTELGEGTFDVLARVVPAFLGALASVGWHARQGGWVCDEGAERKTVAVFAHGGSLNAMLSFLLGVRPFPVGCFSFPHCGVATVSFRSRRGVWYPELELPAPGGGASADRLRLEGLAVRTVLGVLPEERAAPRDVRLDLDVGLDLARAGRSDDLADTVDWAWLAAAVRTFAESASFGLAEALAEAVARFVLDKVPAAAWVRVAVAKPGAMPGVARFAAEVVRSRTSVL